MRSKIPYLMYILAGIENNYCLIWCQNPRIYQNAKFHEQQKNFKFGSKNALFEYFEAEISKTYYHIWHQNLWICQNTNCCAKIKTLLFIWVVLVSILKNYCHIWNQQFWFCQIAKYCGKIKKTLNFETKMTYLCFLDRNFKKTFVIFEIRTPEFVQVCFIMYAAIMKLQKQVNISYSFLVALSGLIFDVMIQLTKHFSRCVTRNFIKLIGLSDF